jgi:hypothetical protein
VAYPPPPALADSVSDLAIEAPVDVSGTLNADPEVQSP